MRLAVLVLLSALIPQAPQSQTGTIEGTVMTTGSTIMPIAGAQIRASGSTDPRPATPFSVETTTDGAGHFILADVPAGSIKLEVTQEGYGKSSGLSFDSTLTVYVKVTPGQRVQAPGLALTPVSTVRGRVLDGEGHGVAGLDVEFLQLSGDALGQKRWAPMRRDVQTNDRGEYERTMLGPGDYYVRTILDSRGDLPFAVYYPGTTDASAAAPLVLSEGSEAVADIRIGSALDAPAHKVSGKVTNPILEKATGPAELILLKRGTKEPIEPDSQLSAFSTADEATGKFEFRGIRPGSYDLVAGSEIAGRQYLSKIPIEVRDQDIDNADLVLHAGKDIKGRLVIEGNPQEFQFWRSSPGGPVAGTGNFRVSLIRKDGFRFGLSPEPVIDGNGTSFTFREVPEGDYALSVNLVSDGQPPNPDLYLADIRAGGRSVFDTGFQVGVDPVDLMEVVVGTNGGSVEGTLQGKAAVPAALILVPDSSRLGNPVLYRMTFVAANGQFRLNRLVPGTYKLFSVPFNPGETTLPYRDPGFLARHESRALSITVQKGRTTVGLQVPFLSLGK